MILEYWLQGSFCFWHTDAYKYSTSGWICATSTTCISLVIVSSYQIFDYKSLRTLIWKTTYSEGQICCHLTLLSTKLIHFHSILKLNIYHERNIIFLICGLATLLHRMIMREQQFAFFFFQHHVIIFKQFCVVFFYFQVHCVVNVHPPKICSKWFSGSVTVTRWWIQWFMASQAKNSNVSSVTSLAVNAGKAKDLGKYSAIHSTITMNDQIAIFHLPTRKWSPLNST